MNAVWVLETRKADGWGFCNNYLEADSAKEAAPNYHPAPAELRWVDVGQHSSYGFFGQASVAAFRLRLLGVLP